MEQSFATRCVNGHQVNILCINKDCIHPSGICDYQGCLYERVHNNCHKSSDVNNIIAIILNSAKSNQKIANQLLVGSIDTMIKSLQILRDQYVSVSGSLQYHMTEDKKYLYELLKKGPASKVKAELLLNILEGNNKKEKNNSLVTLKEITSKIIHQHNKGLEEIRRWVQAIQSDKIKFVFDKELNSNNVVIVSNEGKNLTNIKSQSIFSLITPSIFEAKNKKITLKVVEKDEWNNFIGLVRKGKVIQSKLDWTDNNEGLCIIGDSGYTYNHSPHQYKRNLEFDFDKGHVLELEYLESAQCLKITNLTLKKSILLENINNDDKDLHYCIRTYLKHDEWEILESE